jgi:hypothetical protein
MSEGSRIAIGLPNYMNQERNDVFDFEMPQVPKLGLENIQEFKDKYNVVFKFGFIGAGQGGGKLAEPLLRLVTLGSES